MLLLRAAATRSIGRVDDAVADIDRAVSSAATSEPRAAPPGRRRGGPRPPRRGSPRGRRARRRAGARRPRRRRGAHLRPGLRGARRVRGDVERPRRPAAGRRVLPDRRGGVGGVRRVRPRPGLPARSWRWACSSSSGGTTRRSPSSASCWRRPTCPTPSARWTVLSEGFVLVQRQPAGERRRRGSSASPTSATCTTTRG